jgi:hypothetical protein
MTRLGLTLNEAKTSLKNATNTSMSACANSSPDGTKWQGVAHAGSPVTLSMENAVCCVRVAAGSKEHGSGLPLDRGVL